MGAECWLCAGRGKGQVCLRPDGQSDGRKVCGVCTRRLVEWLGGLPAPERPARLSPIWPDAAAAAPDGDPEVDAVRAAVFESVDGRLAETDDGGRIKVALGYLELGLVGRGLEALAGVSPVAVDAQGQRTLTSLLSRLLHPAVLGPGAREILERALYPGLERR